MSFGQWAQSLRSRERTGNWGLTMWVLGRGRCVECRLFLRPEERGEGEGPGEWIQRGCGRPRSLRCRPVGFPSSLWWPWCPSTPTADRPHPQARGAVGWGRARPGEGSGGLCRRTQGLEKVGRREGLMGVSVTWIKMVGRNSGYGEWCASRRWKEGRICLQGGGGSSRLGSHPPCPTKLPPGVRT